jgi:hypothetical protein
LKRSLHNFKLAADPGYVIVQSTGNLEKVTNKSTGSLKLINNVVQINNDTHGYNVQLTENVDSYHSNFC